MLLLGTCNPPGEADGYNGLYLTDAELRAAVKEQTLLGVPVKTEHAGAEVGRIVSVFLGPKSELQAVLEVDENSLTGCLAGGFVRDGVAADLSLGYTVDVRHSSGSRSESDTSKRLQAGEKRVLEVSLVRKGARKGCHIHAYEDGGRVFVLDNTSDPWSVFDMGS